MLPYEAVTRQHKLVVADPKVPKERNSKHRKRQPRTKVWKLKDSRERYNEKIKELRAESDKESKEVNIKWREMWKILEEAASTCGKTRGGCAQENDTWWWNDQVQEVLKKKKYAYKAMHEGKGYLREYNRLKREAKREVAKAKERAWKEWYARLDSIKGEDQIYRIAKSRAKQQEDITKVAGTKNKLDSIVTEENKIRERWQEYFIELLNIENGREQLPKINKVQGPV